MNKTKKRNKRMEELFKIEGFKESLRTLHLQNQLIVGAPCPAPDCENTLHEDKIEYTDASSEPWKMAEVNLLACDCGFATKQEKERKHKGTAISR